LAAIAVADCVAISSITQAIAVVALLSVHEVHGSLKRLVKLVDYHRFYCDRRARERLVIKTTVFSACWFTVLASCIAIRF
jgi:hypothetical protein